ncbi:Glutathione S-transferase [Ferrimonas sediminum]|uniref:glutathione transferase n=1 Tax=Ferrimonas sediminum TaxID=718193 RepID=A0A1G8VFR9_9GAMM|nr:glutathione S-transferase family protein [Ferrimonas sediminum]SDJ64931.1 Glutathione S-transferase [Ferrimonas sediminum]
MKIYEASMTPSAQRVSLFLAEMNLDIERVQVDVRGGENLSDAFLALSPNGRIPVLELDDGTTLCESIAICRYFDALHPGDHSLFGTTPLEKGQVEMWTRIVEHQGLVPAFQAFRNLSGVYADRERCVEAWGEESRKRLDEFLPKLEQRLGESTYLAGERFTVADITAWALFAFMERVKFALAQPYPNIDRWRSLVAARPAFS